jgi:hypothetical protein
MMASVQHSPPEHPNPFPLQAAEERPRFHPLDGGAVRQLREPSLRQPDVLVDVPRDDRLVAWRKEFFDGRLPGADELSEEAPLAKKLVDQDRADRVHLLVPFEVEKGVRDRSPHADRLVCLAGVGGDDLLEDRLDGCGHINIGDSDEVIVYGRLALSPHARNQLETNSLRVVRVAG